MNYTDRDLLVATQIAYYSFDLKLLESLSYSANLYEILQKDEKLNNKMHEKVISAEQRDSEYVNYRAVCGLKLYEEISSLESKYSKWIIRNVRDDNSNTGFYACVIETSPNDAIVAFRGSESNNLLQIKKDWVDADMALVNSTLTRQQDEADRYMADVNDKYSYLRYAVTGHSLGGNLSSHGTLYAPAAMRDKIILSINFDGPGFSDEYLANSAPFRDSITKVMRHYQWSFIGNLLFHVPEVTYTSVLTNPLVNGKYDLEPLSQKHDTCFVMFDENNNVIPDDMDNFAIIIGNLSRAMEHSPTWANNELACNLCKVAGDTEGNAHHIAADMMKRYGMLSKVLPPETVKALMLAGFTAVIGFINPEFFQSRLIPILNSTLNVGLHVEAVLSEISDMIHQFLKTGSDIIKKSLGEIHKLLTFKKLS